MESAFAEADKAQREREEKKQKDADVLAERSGAATGAATGEKGVISTVVN